MTQKMITDIEQKIEFRNQEKDANETCMRPQFATSIQKQKLAAVLSSKRTFVQSSPQLFALHSRKQRKKRAPLLFSSHQLSF